MDFAPINWPGYILDTQTLKNGVPQPKSTVCEKPPPLAYLKM